MKQWLRRVHIAILAWFVTHYRRREIIRVFTVAHANELKQVELQYWPSIRSSHGQELRQVRERLKAELSAVEFRQLQEVAAIRAGKMEIVDRKSWAWPFLPSSVNRMATPIQKSTPYNLRRMSRTPVPRRGMNLIKGAVITQPWTVEAIEGVEPPDGEDGQKERIAIAKKFFEHPNNTDSFQTFTEMGLEDMLTLGGWASELRVTLDPERPLKAWIVNIESIRIFPGWEESTPDRPHYAQMTGLKGERGAVVFYDDEMMYLKDNPSSDNPFGLGAIEIGFRSLNDLLGLQDMAGRAGTDQVHKTWLWWEAPQTEAAYQIVRRHIQNELEGQAKVSLIGGMKKPDIIEVNPVTEDDLLLNWQEMLIRMIANALDLSAMSLGIEHDVNRAVGQVLDDKDFRSAVVPRCIRIQNGYTRKILHEKLKWTDLKFRFLNLEDPDMETKMSLNAQGYSANARTPREIRISMGWAERDNPFDDLSQFEAMMLNVEAQAAVQMDMQQKMMQIQQDMQQKQMEQQQDQQEQYGYPASGGSPQPGVSNPQPTKTNPASNAKGGQPQAPKPLALPKFTIAGTRYSARQWAQIPVNKLTYEFARSGLSASQLLKAMDDQEPGILRQMSEEAADFFDQQLKLEQKKNRRKVSPALIRKWAKEQVKRYRQDNNRIEDYGTWLVKQKRPGERSLPPKVQSKHARIKMAPRQLTQ